MGGENSLLNSFDGSMREHLVQKVQVTPSNQSPQDDLYVSLRTHLLVYSFPVALLACMPLGTNIVEHPVFGTREMVSSELGIP